MNLDEKKIKVDNAVVDQIKQQQEYKLLGTYTKKVDGGKVFEYNPENSELKEVNFIESDTYDLTRTNRKRIDVTQGCIYVEALNRKNAIKRLNKMKIAFVA